MMDSKNANLHADGPGIGTDPHSRNDKIYELKGSPTEALNYSRETIEERLLKQSQNSLRSSWGHL